MKPILRLFHILHWVLHMSSYFGDEQERSLVGASRSMQQRKKKINFILKLARCKTSGDEFEW